MSWQPFAWGAVLLGLFGYGIWFFGHRARLKKPHSRSVRTFYPFGSRGLILADARGRKLRLVLRLRFSDCYPLDQLQYSLLGSPPASLRSACEAALREHAVRLIRAVYDYRQRELAEQIHVILHEYLRRSPEYERLLRVPDQPASLIVRGPFAVRVVFRKISSSLRPQTIPLVSLHS